MVFIPIHKHFLLTTEVEKVITSVPEAKTMLCHIVDAVKMRRVTEPQAYYVKDEGNEGLTGSINLATSHVAFHVWDNEQKLVMDVYSCKEFDTKDVIKTLNLYFGDLHNPEGFVIDRETYIMERVKI